MCSSLGLRAAAPRSRERSRRRRARPRGPRLALMLTTYRRVYSRPGAFAFSATALVARLPISMMTLGIVLLVSSLSGSYGLAGQVSAAYIVGNAVFAIPHGRLADRFGQGKVLYVDTVAFAVTTTLMIVSIVEDWAMPWPHVLGRARRGGDPPDRHDGAGALGPPAAGRQRAAHGVRGGERLRRGRVRDRPGAGHPPRDRHRPAGGSHRGRDRRDGRHARPGRAAAHRATGPSAGPDDATRPDAVGAARAADRGGDRAGQRVRRPRGRHRRVRRRPRPQGVLRPDARRVLARQPHRRRRRRHDHLAPRTARARPDRRRPARGRHAHRCRSCPTSRSPRSPCS